MKVVYVSNYLNHHQLPLAKKLYEALGEDYVFIAMSGPSEERKKLGYTDINRDYPFVLCAYDGQEQKKKAEALVWDCDVLLAGNCPDEYMLRRVKAGKLTVKTSERYFKESGSFVNTLKHFFRARKHLAPFQQGPLYFLGASAYLAKDINRFTKFDGRAYRWGYFPETHRYESLDAVFEKKQADPTLRILWSGRLLDWKHPEQALLVAQRLRAKGVDFQLSIIGTGPMEAILKEKIQTAGLEDHVTMLGSMKPEQVRCYMEAADIFLFTSDQTEGWGAVLNESMNSGCAVIACRQTGSAPFLLKHRHNGLIYDRVDELLAYGELLARDGILRQQLGRAAYRTIAEEWNCDVAAERLLRLLEQLREAGSCDLFEDGPCSRAPILK